MADRSKIEWTDAITPETLAEIRERDAIARDEASQGQWELERPQRDRGILLAALADARALNAEMREGLEKCRSALDRLMGDSDLPEDDSPEFLACQAASDLISRTPADAGAAMEQLRAELREAATDLMVCAHNARAAVHRGDDKWTGVPQLLEAKAARIDALLSRTPADAGAGSDVECLRKKWSLAQERCLQEHEQRERAEALLRLVVDDQIILTSGGAWLCENCRSEGPAQDRVAHTADCVVGRCQGFLAGQPAAPEFGQCHYVSKSGPDPECDACGGVGTRPAAPDEARREGCE